MPPATGSRTLKPAISPAPETRQRLLWRKGCFGNQSGNGSRFTERILTTVATLRQQDRNIVEYVVAAITSHRIGQLALPLLPVPSSLVEAAKRLQNIILTLPVRVSKSI